MKGSGFNLNGDEVKGSHQTAIFAVVEVDRDLPTIRQVLVQEDAP